MLRTRSIKALAELSDGTRISVMSRHTLNDGTETEPVNCHRRISAEEARVLLPELVLYIR